VNEYFGSCIGQVVGEGTTGVNYIPLNTYYRYSYTQQIFDAELLGAPGKITQIAFNYIFGTANPKNNQTIYLAHTTKNTFTGATDWIPISEFTPVYTGTINYNNANTWFTIELDEPFEYTGGNLVLAYLNNHGDYLGSNPTFNVHSTTGIKTLNYRVDGSTPINPAAPPAAYETLQQRSNTRFVICPTGLFNIYRDDELIAEEWEGNSYYDDDNFDPYIGHTWTITQVCAMEEFGESDPVSVTLPACKCRPVENLTAVYNENCEAVLSWDAPAYKSGKKTIELPDASMYQATANKTPKPMGMNNTDVSPFLGQSSFVGDGSKAMWDVAYTFTALEAAHPAVATDGNHWYTASWNPAVAAYQFVRYNMDGSNPTPFTISGVPSELRSLTYDGTIFYGGAASSTIYKLDLANQTSLGTISAGSTTRHLCYDPTLDGGNGGFWHGDWSNIRAITMTGTQIYANTTVDGVYGSAYDPHSNPGTPYLWLFTQTGVHDVTLQQFDCTTRTLTGVTRDVYNDYPFSGSQMAGGAFAYQSGATYYLAVNIQDDANKVIVYELANTNPNIAAAPTNFTVTPVGTSLSANLAWTNPSTTLAGDPLTSITKMVIKRDGTQVHEITTGVTPGANMTWKDTSVPNAGEHCYAVYAVTSEGDGASASDCAIFGNMCPLTLVLDDDYGDGWSGGAVTVIVDGASIGTYSCSGYQSIHALLVPSGHIEFSWTHDSYSEECGVTILDYDDNILWQSPAPIAWPYGGPGNGMYDFPDGVFFDTDYVCGSASTYNIYCDGILIEEEWPDTYYVHDAMHPLYPMNPYLTHTWCVEAPCPLNNFDQECVSIDTICGPEDLWHVFGVVKMANNNFIVGANLTLDGWVNYETNSVAYGVFDFENVHMTDFLPGGYLLTSKFDGFQDYTQNVIVTGHTNLGTLIMLEIPYPPTNVVATDAGNQAAITWELPEVTPITGIGYKVYRLEAGQEEDPTSWVTLTNTPVSPAMNFNDVVWNNLPQGTYKWAVITCYAGNVVSTPTFSNELVKIITVPYTIRLTTNSGDSPAGANVTLTGPQTYTDVAGITGVVFPNVQIGNYTLEITLDGFNKFEADLEITATGTYTAQLIETINDPTNPAIGLDNTSAQFTWSHEALKPFLGFTIYLNGTVKAVGVAEKEYLFTNLPNGTYIAGVQANYASGNSEIVNAESFNVGINEYENDFGIYPNPAQDMITVERATSASATIELYNAMGAHIQTYETIESKYEIDVRTLAAGTYFIRVIEDDYTGVKSFVKK
jgi:hypothetical protein